MSRSRAYAFHQCEIQDLKTARAYAVGICDWVTRLQEGIHRNEPNWAAYPVKEILDHNNKLEFAILNPVDHLLTPVAQPAVIPSWNAISGRLRNASSDVLKLDLAHRAAWRLHSFLYDRLWDVWGRKHAGKLASRDVVVACDELVSSRWQELQQALKPVVEFDCNELRSAVELESAMALERCRQSVMGDCSNAFFGSQTASGIGGTGGCAGPITPAASNELTEAAFRKVIASYKPNQWKTGLANTRKTMAKVNSGLQCGWIFGEVANAVGFANCKGRPLIAKKDENGNWQTLIATSLNKKTQDFFSQFPAGQFKMQASRSSHSDA